MTYKLVVRDSIQEINEQAWNRLTAEKPFGSWRWQAYCERVFEKERSFYLIVEQDNAFVAAAICWLFRKPNIPDIPHFIEQVLSPLFRRRPLLICMVPISETYGLFLPEDTMVSKAAFNLILAGVDQLASEHNALFTIYGYLPRRKALENDWPSAYQITRLFPGTKIQLEDIPDYETYLSLRTKKHRKNIRRNRAAAVNNGAVLVRKSQFDTDTALKLASNVTAKYKFPVRDEMDRVFAFADMVESCWLTVEINDRIVGFDLLLGDRDQWMIKTTGSDYSADHLYFFLSDEDIRYAIDVGAKTLYAGTHLYQVKLRLGYEQRENGFVRFSSNSRLGIFLKWLLKLRMKPPSDTG